MITCENKLCEYYHKDLVRENRLDEEYENTGEKVEICGWCQHLAYYLEDKE